MLKRLAAVDGEGIAKLVVHSEERPVYDG